MSPRPYASWPDVSHHDHGAMRQILSHHEVGPNRTVRRQPRPLAFEIASLAEAGCGQTGGGEIHLVAVGIRETHPFDLLFAAPGSGFEGSLVRPALARSGKLLAGRLTLEPTGKQPRREDRRTTGARRLSGRESPAGKVQPAPVCSPSGLCFFVAWLFTSWLRNLGSQT